MVLRGADEGVRAPEGGGDFRGKLEKGFGAVPGGDEKEDLALHDGIAAQQAVKALHLADG